jgi:putative PEP-CTERM system histidine kinase
MLYLLDTGDRQYYLAGTFDVIGAPATVAADDWLPTALTSRPEPLVLDAPLSWDADAVADTFPGGSVTVPLSWRGALTGFVVVGPERTGVPYTLEDLQFMATMSQQATGAIVTARLSEDLARAREFDAFARIASFVIHDLKNMISGLSLLAENAAKFMHEPEFQKDAVVTLSRTVERMQRLMARLSSRAEPVVLQGQQVSLAKVVTDTLDTTPVPQGLSVVTDIDPVPVISGDGDALMRLVQNLVMNAIQAMDGDGTLTVTVKERARSAVLTVADTGPGMSEEFIRESLFVPFKTTKPGGWGIGLYQVKEIVERHEGHMRVSSTVGRGTTFEVTLPV